MWENNLWAHPCLPVEFFLSCRKHIQWGSLWQNNGNCGSTGGTHCCITMGTKVTVQKCCTSSMQKWPNDSLNILLLNSDLNGSVTMSYIMWHEEHLWNVSVLQSFPVFSTWCHSSCYITTSFKIMDAVHPSLQYGIVLRLLIILHKLYLLKSESSANCLIWCGDMINLKHP
jgi:hypothetical protein